METSYSETTYCSEAEEILMNNSGENIKNSQLRRSRRQRRKPEQLNESVKWDDIKVGKNRLILKKSQELPKSKCSSQFLTKEIDDCSYKTNKRLNRPKNLFENIKNYGTNFNTDSTILNQPSEKRLQVQTNTVEINALEGTPIDLRKRSRSLGSGGCEHNLDVVCYNLNDGKVSQQNRENMICDLKEVGAKSPKRIKLENDENAIDKSELIDLTLSNALNKDIAMTSCSKKRCLPVSDSFDDQSTLTKRKKKCTTNALRRKGRVQKNNTNKNGNFEVDLSANNVVFDKMQSQTHVQNREQLHLNTTVPLLHAIENPTKLNVSNFIPPDLRETKPSLEIQDIDNRKITSNFTQNISSNIEIASSKSHSRRRNIKKTANQYRNSSSPSKTKIQPKLLRNHKEIIFKQIPKITTIPILPAASDSLLPKVYPPHFTGQLPVPVPEPIPVGELKNIANFNETQVILSCDRELNYWLTPELTQPFDEEALSSSTPSLSDSLKGIFETDNYREILRIEKIVYRLGENHVRALAMVLNIRLEVLNEILKNIVRLDESILKKVNNMMKVKTFDINDSSERVEPYEMVTSPISSLSVELIESPKATSSRIFLSQRHTKDNLENIDIKK